MRSLLNGFVIEFNRNLLSDPDLILKKVKFISFKVNFKARRRWLHRNYLVKAEQYKAVAFEILTVRI